MFVILYFQKKHRWIENLAPVMAMLKWVLVGVSFLTLIIGTTVLYIRSHKAQVAEPDA